MGPRASSPLPRLRKTLRSTRDQHYDKSLGWPASATFVLSYFGILVMVNLFGVNTLSPLAHDLFRAHPLDLSFYLFWHETSWLGISFMTAVMSCNALVAIYLWVSFRSEGRRELSKRLFFLSSAAVLMTFQLLYWILGTENPPQLILLPLSL